MYAITINDDGDRSSREFATVAERDAYVEWSARKHPARLIDVACDTCGHPANVARVLAGSPLVLCNVDAMKFDASIERARQAIRQRSEQAAAAGLRAQTQYR